MFGWLFSFPEDIFTTVFAINMEFNQSEYYMEDKAFYYIQFQMRQFDQVLSQTRRDLK